MASMAIGFFVVTFLLQYLLLASVDAKPSHCQSKCGNITIPYPFGIGEECSIDKWFTVYCNTTFHPPKPFLAGGEVELIEVSQYEIRIKTYVFSSCNIGKNTITFNQNYMSTFVGVVFEETPFTLSSKNMLIVLGCNTVVRPTRSFGTSDYMSACVSTCGDGMKNGLCFGNGCCENSIPQGLKAFYIEKIGRIQNYDYITSLQACDSTIIVEKEKYSFNVSDLSDISSLGNNPMVLNWAVGNQSCQNAERERKTFACKVNSHCYDSVDGNGYLCDCTNGFEGNPYLGCKDIDECKDPHKQCRTCTNTEGNYTCSCPHGSFGDGTKDGTGCQKKPNILGLQLSLGLVLGFMFLLVGSSWLCLITKKRKLLKLKQKFFQQNGGLLLKQQISSLKGGTESSKIFTGEELKLATNNYDQHRILGQGGYGTVYKGILPDLTIVAIKKSKIIDGSQLGQFINEIIILTQISHRNIVKLLGCCLETELPLLVYEFVSNGSLSQHLQKKSGAMSYLCWEDRLRIAAETAGALSYLHSAHSIPIIHRDVKSANILLDNNYTAKVADFGISRLTPLDETHINTLVQGTFGYLDPEYLRTSQLTEKSDVYSFGVVLVELLTGEKPVSFERSEAWLLGILNEGNEEQVQAVAEVANRCLNLKGEERPSMKEVAAELERLRGFKRHTLVQQSNEEIMTSEFEQVELSTIPSVEEGMSDGLIEQATMRANLIHMSSSVIQDISCQYAIGESTPEENFTF
ncbi:hypothetical protein AQUCO_04300033v1 [Aquilegia coerulea]|uniref:Protein kinase domain-containing protein n=1 Tax=Aquilegia coerulea TaxID=218851 RepID=A0A2G5CNG4_AQUCA|nr:hypothetical protein AQUCO_04300033v1 [Aquilegia coerulea]